METDGVAVATEQKITQGSLEMAQIVLQALPGLW